MQEAKLTNIGLIHHFDIFLQIARKQNANERKMSAFSKSTFFPSNNNLSLKSGCHLSRVDPQKTKVKKIWQDLFFFHIEFLLNFFISRISNCFLHVIFCDDLKKTSAIQF